MDFKIISKIKQLLESLELDSYQMDLVFKDSTELQIIKSPESVKETVIGFTGD